MKGEEEKEGAVLISFTRNLLTFATPLISGPRGCGHLRTNAMALRTCQLCARKQRVQTWQLYPAFFSFHDQLSSLINYVRNALLDFTQIPLMSNAATDSCLMTIHATVFLKHASACVRNFRTEKHGARRLRLATLD